MRTQLRHYFYDYKQGNPDNEALVLVNNLRAQIEQRYADLAASIIDGAQPESEVEIFASQMPNLLNDVYLDVWDILHDEPDLDTIDAHLELQQENLNEFSGALLAGMAADGPEKSLSSQAGTILLYAGSAWALHQMSKISGHPPESIWRWEGGLTQGSCNTCIDEVNKGARPLSEITILPATDTECMGNCRHTLVLVS